MALYFIKDTTLSNIANAIRSKTGDSASIPVADFASEIESIVVGDGSSSGGGGSGEGDTIIGYEVITKSGTFETGSGVESKSITHNCRGMPDLVIVYLKRNDFAIHGDYNTYIYSTSKLNVGDMAICSGLAYENGSSIYCTTTTFEVSNLVENSRYGWYAMKLVNKEISGGGDHTVTFMSEDGSTVLGRKGVMDGDTCGDPVSAGLFETPTKESTAEFTYSFAGWSTTPGGELDPNALTNITGDKTVYVSFVGVVRLYTIKYYDGDTLLKSVKLAYGLTPETYIPEKDGYFFAGWNPSLQAVTGDADYQVIWEEIPKFSTATWAQISKISSEGKASQYFKVGDTKTITLTDGTTQVLRIIGLDHDDLSDGSGKAGITMCSSKCWYSYVIPFNNSQKKYNNVTSYNSGGWSLSDLRTTCNETIFNTLPDDFKSVVKTVDKISDAGDGDKTAFITTQDKIWIWSPEEIGLTSNNGYLKGQGTKYAYFTSKSTRQITPPNQTSCNGYALRSSLTQTSGYVAYYHSNDMVSSSNGASSKFIVPCFCV